MIIVPEPEPDAGELPDELDAPGPDELAGELLDELDLNGSNDWEFVP